MLRFNLFLFALPAQLEPDKHVSFGDRRVQAYRVQKVDHNLMPTTFEQSAESLARLPRMFFELDGSFVWRGDCAGSNECESETWQVDGMIYDVAGKIARVELKGSCPVKRFEQLIQCIQPADQLLAYSQDHGYFLRVADLLRSERT